MTARATRRGDARKRVLVPDSAHGTNPATAAICGYSVEAIPLNDRGRVDLAALRAALDDDVAAFMLTNPNTCGLFEDEILEQSQACMMSARFTATAPISMPSWDECGRAISASTACI